MYQFPKMKRLTDSTGRMTDYGVSRPEPEPGSVVLTEGEFGTAWQRHFRDGNWHRSGGGRPITWDKMLTKRNLVVAYDAPKRAEVLADEEAAS